MIELFCPPSSKLFTPFTLLLLLLLPLLAHGECSCDLEETDNANKSKLLTFKIIAIASILSGGVIGVCIPILSEKISAFKPGSNFFFMMKSFAAGVILATGFIHVLPDAFDNLTSPCLKENPWGNFPFTGFIAMMAAIAILMVENVATSYFQRLSSNNSKLVNVDEEKNGELCSQVHVHTHVTHGHAHGRVGESNESGGANLIRHRVIAQVLELGIVVHSVIIGISLGASGSPSIIKPLLIALCFHQFFEGMGLGGCISEAKFKVRPIAVMAAFFALTTPIGIAIGIGITNVYKENSQTALVVEGVLNAASAGILIYMALVDLLAADFMSAKIQNNGKLQLHVYVCLLLGAGLMSLLAKWA
ncbi:hypothetical protein IFM89_031593 [Coptis chinensis]|uniref:Uncharacterized protein n=1 Tax=Coptis chinensis TaxID=261450 RepID=A0A835LH27_9MAGN|nr:hypothetical protein IFM89_031593 [Coptis chinensis]